MKRHYIALVLTLGILPIYVLMINFMPSDITYENYDAQTESGATESVGFRTEVSATVQRDYYMGLVSMKTRVLGFNVDTVSKLMPWIVMFLSASSYRIFK
jgi:hypothetical protein